MINFHPDHVYDRGLRSRRKSSRQRRSNVVWLFHAKFGDPVDDDKSISHQRCRPSRLWGSMWIPTGDFSDVGNGTCQSRRISMVDRASESSSDCGAVGQAHVMDGARRIVVPLPFRCPPPRRLKYSVTRSWFAVNYSVQHNLSCSVVSGVETSKRLPFRIKIWYGRFKKLGVHLYVEQLRGFFPWAAV